MATRFVTATGSEGDAINALADALVGGSGAGDYIANATAAVTFDTSAATALTFIDGILVLSGQTVAVTVTPPTAAKVVAVIPNCQIGSSFDFMVVNTNATAGTATMQANSGVTYAGGNAPTVITFTTSQLYRCVVTNVATPAYTIYSLLYTTS